MAVPSRLTINVYNRWTIVMNGFSYETFKGGYSEYRWGYYGGVIYPNFNHI